MIGRTVTFLFTDIEGSTRLWEEDPEAMRPALARHDALVRQAISSHGGQTFKTVGDAFCAAFDDALAAVGASLAAQSTLARETWATPRPIRVRMALHTGTAEVRDEDYFGPPLNRVARLLSTCHGGQTLLSSATYELVRDTLPAGVSLAPLGEHRLKDLARPEAVYGLLAPGLPAEFPPLRSLDSEALPNNLPAQATSFIGRERELASLVANVETKRLVTLTGAGGSGKTRLALQAAAELLGRPAARDGAWLVELAPLVDPALVASTVLEAVGLREKPGRGALASLADGLRDRAAVVVLDNCEHVLAACANLAGALLRGCPGVRILATSREALNLAGEAVVRVPALALPDAREAARATPESLDAYDSVRLFVERARAALPSFAVTNTNAPAVAALCARLDGIPLALELAAARVKALSVEKILERLDDRFRLLTGGTRSALPRQQTLRALVDWSYDLLSESERTALDRLSVFSGGWTLEAAEAIVGFEPIESWEVLDLLAALVDKSLVAYDAEAERYRMLETIRQYAAERLAARPEEAEAAADRQARFWVAFYEAQGPRWQFRADSKTYGAFEADFDNVRAACERLLRCDGDAAGRLMHLAAPLWFNRGRNAEGLALWERGLAAHPRFGSGESWTVNPVLAGIMAAKVDDYPKSIRYLEKAVEERRRELGMDWIVNGMCVLAGILNESGGAARAKALMLEAQSLYESPPEDARDGPLDTILGSQLGFANTHLSIARAHLGEREAARAHLLRDVARSRQSGALAWQTKQAFYLGWLELEVDRSGSAAPWLMEALDAGIRSGDHASFSFGLMGAIALVHAQGQDEIAGRLAGLHDRVCREGGVLIEPVFRDEHASRVANVRMRLGNEAFEEVFSKGAAMAPDEGAALVRNVAASYPNAPPL